jgi:hypothetical protein
MALGISTTRPTGLRPRSDPTAERSPQVRGDERPEHDPRRVGREPLTSLAVRPHAWLAALPPSAACAAASRAIGTR